MNASPGCIDMSRIKRILIVKLSSIGDVVHALPVTAAIGRSFPHVEISWVVEPMSAPMVEGNPHVRDLIVLPRSWRDRSFSSQTVKGFLEIRRDLRRRRFDLAIDLQGLSKSALVAWASGAPIRLGYDWLREAAPMLERRVPRRAESIHIVDQFLDVARHLGATAEPVEFPLHIPPADVDRARGLLAAGGIAADRPYVVINPSSGGGGHKGWPADRMAAAINAIGLPAVLVGSKGDTEAAEAVASRCSIRPASVVGCTSLKELSAVIRLSALHVCGDTGSAHIAAALGTPVVSIFGRSNPDRLAPYGQAKYAVHRRDACSPQCRAWHMKAPVNSKQKCLAPPPACLAAVPVEAVVEAARRALADSGLA